MQEEIKMQVDDVLETFCAMKKLLNVRSVSLVV